MHLCNFLHEILNIIPFCYRVQFLGHLFRPFFDDLYDFRVYLPHEVSDIKST